MALFLIFLTLFANWRDCTDSSPWTAHRLDVQIRVVFEFPPSPSLRRWVNFELLKGTFSPFPRAVMTIPKVVRLWLIFLASSKTLPVAPVFPILSDPAKSTRFNLALLVDPSLFTWLYSSTKMVWLLELRAFIPVDSVCTDFWPS